MIIRTIFTILSSVKTADRGLIGRLSLVALPIMFQNLLTSSLSFLDTLMIGQLGQQEIAAVGIANQVYFVISLLFFGIASGTSIYLAQYYGAREYGKMRKAMSFATMLCLAGGAIVSILSFIFSDAIIRIFSAEQAVIDAGSTYLRYVAFSYMFSAVSATLSIGFRSTGKASLPLIVSFVSLTMNAIGNYLLIFGIGPFPFLGVAGGAISTFIARLAEMLILALLAWGRHEPFAFAPRKDLGWDRTFIESFAITALPVVLNELFWSLGMTLYKVAYSSLGTEALAAVNITESIGNFFFIAMMGIANGATIVLGNEIGSGNPDKARGWAMDLIVISLLTGAVMGTLEFLLAPLFASWFNVTAAVAMTAISALKVSSFRQPLKSLNMCMIVGVLRSGGDTRYAVFAELGGIWLIGIPLAFIGTRILGLPLPWIYAICAAEEIFQLIAESIRMKNGRWLNILA